MRTIETTAVVTADHTLTVTVPADIPAGPCRVVVVVGTGDGFTPPAPSSLGWANWPAHDVALADPTCTFRREDMYGDDGR